VTKDDKAGQGPLSSVRSCVHPRGGRACYLARGAAADRIAAISERGRGAGQAGCALRIDPPTGADRSLGGACLPKCQNPPVLYARVSAVSSARVPGADRSRKTAARLTPARRSLVASGSAVSPSVHPRDPTAIRAARSRRRREREREPVRSRATAREADARRGEGDRSDLTRIGQRLVFFHTAAAAGPPSGPRQHARAHRAGPAAPGGPRMRRDACGSRDRRRR